MKRKKKNKDQNSTDIPEESKVSKKLSERTTKKVISLVLVMVFFLPMLDSAFWFYPYLSID